MNLESKSCVSNDRSANYGSARSYYLFLGIFLLILLCSTLVAGCQLTPSPPVLSTVMPTTSPLPSSDEPEERIAFIAQRENVPGIYTIRSDGTGLTCVLADRGLIVRARAAWSPDYSRIAFTYYPSWPDYTHPSVYIVNSDGSNLTPLVTRSDTWGPDWSPNGRQIAYHWTSPDSGSEDIFILDVENGKETRLTDNHARDLFLAWSPDNNQVFFYSDRGNGQRLEVYVIDADGGEERKVTDTGLAKSYFDLSPNGAKFLFVGATVRDDAPDPMLGVSDTAFRLFVINSDGSDLQQLPFEYLIYDPSWSPSGDRIVFVGDDPQADRAIYVINSEGTGLSLLIQGAVSLPTWSPDGTRIAFHCGDEICIMNDDGTDVQRMNTNLFSLSPLEWIYQ